MENSKFISDTKNLIDSLTPDPDILYVICSRNIGDFLMNGGFCYALMLIRRKKTCVIIARDRFKNSGLNFVGVSEIVYIPHKIMVDIQNYVFETKAYETDRYIYGHFKYENGNILWSVNLSFIERYRNDVFSLPGDIDLLPPIVRELSDDEKDALEKKYRLGNKTVVIAPYSVSCVQFPMEFWEYIASTLTQKGYYVYTNVGNETEAAVRGTLPMSEDFRGMFYLSRRVLCFTGIRSGIFDLLTMYGARILCINDASFWSYGLNINYPGHERDVVSFYYAGIYCDVVRMIVEKNGIGVEDVKMAVPGVAPEDIYYKEDILADDILKSVEKIKGEIS